MSVVHKFAFEALYYISGYYPFESFFLEASLIFCSTRIVFFLEVSFQILFWSLFVRERKFWHYFWELGVRLGFWNFLYEKLFHSLHFTYSLALLGVRQFFFTGFSFWKFNFTFTQYHVHTKKHRCYKWKKHG